MPDWPESGDTAPDWACEVVKEAPQSALRTLYAQAGVDELWIADLSAHTISAWQRRGDGYRATGETSRTGRAGLAPFEHERGAERAADPRLTESPYGLIFPTARGPAAPKIAGDTVPGNESAIRH